MSFNIILLITLIIYNTHLISQENNAVNSLQSLPEEEITSPLLKQIIKDAETGPSFEESKIKIPGQLGSVVNIGSLYQKYDLRNYVIGAEFEEPEIWSFLKKGEAPSNSDLKEGALDEALTQAINEYRLRLQELKEKRKFNLILYSTLSLLTLIIVYLTYKYWFKAFKLRMKSKLNEAKIERNKSKEIQNELSKIDSNLKDIKKLDEALAKGVINQKKYDELIKRIKES